MKNWNIEKRLDFTSSFDEWIEAEIFRQRRAEIKNHPLVKYVVENGLISVRKLCKIMDCNIEDIIDGI